MVNYLVIDGHVLKIIFRKRDTTGRVCEAYVVNGNWHFEQDLTGRCFAMHDNGAWRTVKHEWVPKEVLEINTNRDLHNMASEELNLLLEPERVKAREIKHIQATNFVI